MTSNRLHTSTFSKQRMAALSLGLAMVACADIPPDGPMDPVRNAQGIAAEVQRVFNDAACYCESYEIVPQSSSYAGPIPDLLIHAPQASGDPLLTGPTGYLSTVGRNGASTTGGWQCYSMSATSVRGSLSTRRYDGTTDPQRFACSWPGDGTDANRPYARAFCRAEVDTCIAHELELAAGSTAHPLDPAVRDAVLAEAFRRLQGATATALAEQTLRITNSTNLCIDPNHPDCVRANGAYGASLYTTWTPDAVSTFGLMSERTFETALAQVDAMTPAMAEETSFSAMAFGPSSPRAALLRSYYGPTMTIAATAPATPAFEPAAITATPPTSASISAGLTMPATLVANAGPQEARIQVFREQERFPLAASLDLTSGGGQMVAAGTRVNVYLVHFDPTTTLTTQALQWAEARLNFGRRILGIQTTATALSSTTFQRAGTTYPAAAARPIEAGQDAVSFSGRTVYAFFVENAGIDEIRVITAAEPDVTPTTVSGERVGDLPYATRVYGEVDVQRTVALLARHRISLPHTACLDAATGEVTQGTWQAQPRSFAQGAFDALETALRTELHRTAPRPAGEPYLLTEVHSIGVNDVADAFDYLRDADALLDGIVLAPPDGAACPAPSIIRQVSPRVRSLIPLQAAVARMGTGALSGSFGTSWYTPSATQTSAIGAAGALQQLRYNLANTYSSLPPSQATALVPVVVETLAAVDQQIGSSWTEWRVCEGSGNCDGDAPGTGRWSLFEANDHQHPLGGAVMVTRASDVRCLLAGHEPLAPGGTCSHVTSDSTRFVALAPIAPSGYQSACTDNGMPFGLTSRYCRRAFRLDGQGSAAPGDRRYVLWRWRLPSDPAGAPDRFELLDVVYLGGGAQVHAFGGEVGARFEDAFDVDPRDPSFLATNTLGFPRDFVPPLEGETIDDGNRSEDSYRTYLARAAVSQQRATAALAQARDHELQMFLHDSTNEAALASATLASVEAVSALCGANTPDADCTVPRIPLVRLGPDMRPGPYALPGGGVACGASCGGSTPSCDPLTLTCVPHVPGLRIIEEPALVAPTVQVRDFEGDATDRAIRCDQFAQLDQHFQSVTDIGSEWGASEAIDTLSEELTCMEWALARTLASAQLDDLAAPVYDAVREGTLEGHVDAYGGEVRQQLIATTSSIEEMRIAIRHMHETVQATQTQLRILRERLGEIDGDLQCYLRAGAQAVATIASVALAFAVPPAGAPAALLLGSMRARQIVEAIGSGSAGAAVFMDRMDACGDADNERAIIALEATLATRSGLTAMNGTLDDVRRSSDLVAAAQAHLDDAARAAALAQARRDVDQRLASVGSAAGDPGWRALAAVERVRAEAALLRAQRDAFIARRAIEARFAVDLTMMSDGGRAFGDALAGQANVASTRPASATATATAPSRSTRAPRPWKTTSRTSKTS